MRNIRHEMWALGLQKNIMYVVLYITSLRREMTICGRAWWANVAEMLVPLQNLVLRWKFATSAG